jgi:ankyrin repeat protein
MKNDIPATKKAAPISAGAAPVNAGAVVDEMERMIAESKTTAKWAILHGLAPIVWAVEQRNPALVRRVIAEGVDLYQTNQEQPNALHVAIFKRDKEIVQILLAAGFDPERPACQDCGKDRSPLCSAVLENQPEIVRMLVRAGADVNAGKPVYQAAYEKLTDMVGLLLELGADPDVQGENEWTPLMYAAYWSDRQMAAHLLAAGADPGIRIKKGNSAFGYRDGDRAVEIARRQGNLELVKLLEQAAAQPRGRRGKNN